MKLDFAFAFYRDVEWKLCESYSASAVGTLLAPKEFENEVRETIDDSGLSFEAGC
jgi:hypothetical protein